LGEGCNGNLKVGLPLDLNTDSKIKRAKGISPHLLFSSNHLSTLVRNSGAFNSQGELVEGITRVSVIAPVTSDTVDRLLRNQRAYADSKSRLKSELLASGHLSSDEIKTTQNRQLDRIRPRLFVDGSFDITYTITSPSASYGSLKLVHFGVNAHARRDWEQYQENISEISRIESARNLISLEDAETRLNTDINLVTDPCNRKGELLQLLRTIYSRYPEPLTEDTIDHLLAPDNIPLLMTGCCGGVVASVIAEHVEFELFDEKIHIYEMGSAATLPHYRDSGIMTFLLLKMQSEILKVHPNAVIFAEARIFAPILHAVFNAGMVRAGMLPFHTYIESSNDHDGVSPQFESLVVVYFPYKSPDVEVSTGPRIGDHASPDCNSI